MGGFGGRPKLYSRLNAGGERLTFSSNPLISSRNLLRWREMVNTKFEYLIDEALIFPNGEMSMDKKKKSKKGPWEDWDTAFTIWNFNVGKKGTRQAHLLEDLENIKYFKDRRRIYKNATFPGTLVPQLVEKLIIKYSNEGDLILDPFLGSGTTIVEARVQKRKVIGIDINPGAIELCNRKLNLKTVDMPEEITDKSDFKIIEGNAQEELKKLPDRSVDLVLLHPPYGTLFHFTDVEGDLSTMSLEGYLKVMKDIFIESFRLLKDDKYCIAVIGDQRKVGIVPYGSYFTSMGLMAGFNLWDVIISDTRFGGKQIDIYRQMRSKKHHFHLQSHDYVLVFQKRKLGKKLIDLQGL
jgi:DNA modification methylase